MGLSEYVLPLTLWILLYILIYYIFFFEEDVDNEYINIYIRKEYIEKGFEHLISPKTVANCSDLVVFCIDHNSGGAYKTMRYANKMEANTINLANAVDLPTVG